MEGRDARGGRGKIFLGRLPGDVSSGQLSDAIDGTANNANGVALLGTWEPHDPPEPQDLRDLRDKIDELINALRR